MLAEIPVAETLATLDRAAEDLLWEPDVSRPPIDALAVARRIGMHVAADGGGGGRARYARLARDGRRAAVEAILVRSEDRPERRQFAVAHEVGEAHAWRVFDALGIDPREAPADARERVANALAGRLLAPTRWLRGVWRDSDADLFETKRAFATASHELLARRLLECVRVPLVVTVTDHDRVAWRRWSLSGVAPPRLRVEVECQRHAHEEGEPAWADGRDAPHGLGGSPVLRVRAWPVHEPAWRREVTVTELRGDDGDWAC